MAERNYTLGRGEVHFARFKPNTQIPDGYRYLGNTPEFSLTLESETLDHFSSDRGIREKDASVTVEVTRSATIVADEIMAENIAMFLFGAVEKVAEAGGAVVGETIQDVVLGRSYPLGVTDANPIGVLAVAYPGAGGTLFKVTDSTGATTYDPVDDYVWNANSAMLTIVDGGAIAAGSDIKVSYTELAYSYDKIASGAEPVNGALKFVARNPMGDNFNYTLPWVAISPNGDYNLKGEEWQQLPFSVEILRKGALEGVYVNGVPFVTP